MAQKYEKKLNERRKYLKSSIYFWRLVFSFLLIISFTRTGMTGFDNIVEVNDLIIVDILFNCVVAL